MQKIFSYLERRRKYGKKGNVEWITPQLLVGIVVVAILLIIIWMLGGKIYSAVFGEENDRLMKVQFSVLGGKIKTLLEDNDDHAVDTMWLQPPEDESFFILGFDAGASDIVPGTSTSSSTKKPGVRALLVRQASTPGDKALQDSLYPSIDIDPPKTAHVNVLRPSHCGDALESCLCLYSTAGIKKYVYAKDEPAENSDLQLEPIECIRYGQNVIFSVRTSVEPLLSDLTFMTWTEKSSKDKWFEKYSAYDDIRLHDDPAHAISDISKTNDKGFYKTFVIGLSRKWFTTTSKSIYIEKSTWWMKDGNDLKKATFIFVSDADPSMLKRQDMLASCSKLTAKSAINDCSTKHEGTTLGGLSLTPACIGPKKESQCIYDLSIDSCKPVCVESCVANKNVGEEVDIEKLGVACICDDDNGQPQVYTDGICKKTQQPSPTTYKSQHILPHCLMGEITKPCVCAGAERAVGGRCYENKYANNKETYSQEAYPSWLLQ